MTALSRGGPRGMQLPAAARGPVPTTIVFIALASTVLMLAAGLVLKACPSPIAGRRPGLLCYSDIPQLYDARGIREHMFPYIHVRGADASPGPGAIEYPVLTGLFMWATGFFATSPKGYLFTSALLLALFALAATYLLARMVGYRSLLWAAAPALVLYAFHNWDLLAVYAVVSGVFCWWRGRPLWAAALFAIGGALKLYPMLFIPPLALDRWSRGEVRSALQTLAVGAGSWTTINLPFILVDARGWAATYEFHGSRPANIDSIWGLGFASLRPRALTLVVTVLLLGSFATVLAVTWIRSRRRRGPYPFLPGCAALLAAFLLFNKVHSPQYILWLLPFFALLDVKLRWWIAYSINDIILYVVLFMVGRVSLDAARPWLYATVYARAAMLAALVVVFLRSDLAAAFYLIPAERSDR